MNNPQKTGSYSLLQFINEVEVLRGLKFEIRSNLVIIYQLFDGKQLEISKDQILNLIKRSHEKNALFFQINYRDGRKILLTENLIGFKPAAIENLDMMRIPKVVTTPDLKSVIDAIEDECDIGNKGNAKYLELVKVYKSIEKGAENIGINTNNEKLMLSKIVNFKSIGNA